MPYVYILECADGGYYTGSTWDLDRRLREHQNGEGANYTKKRLPVKLVYYEEYARIDETFQREKQIQGWSRRKKEALIEGNNEKLVEYARNYTQFGRDASTSTHSADANSEPSED
ncbi:MAG: GIY-YIG nuclease family protein [Caldilineaceae bacterium]